MSVSTWNPRRFVTQLMYRKAKMMQMYLSVVMVRMCSTVEKDVNRIAIMLATQIPVSWTMLQDRNNGIDMAPVQRSDIARLVKM